MNASKRPLLDCAILIIFLCSLPSAHSSSQKCLKTHIYAQASEKRVLAAPIRNVLPFKDQKSANAVSKQLGDLSGKVNVDISPVHTCRRIRDEIKVSEDKLPLVNLRCVMYPPP